MIPRSVRLKTESSRKSQNVHIQIGKENQENIIKANTLPKDPVERDDDSRTSTTVKTEGYQQSSVIVKNIGPLSTTNLVTVYCRGKGPMQFPINNTPQLPNRLFEI